MDFMGDRKREGSPSPGRRTRREREVDDGKGEEREGGEKREGGGLFVRLQS